MSDPLLYQPEEAALVFEELGRLFVALDDDPLAFGPKRLNHKTSEVRRMLDRCERIFLDISHRLFNTRRALRSLSTQIEMAKKSLYASDPETRSGRSVADRDAIASGKMMKEIRRMNELESAVVDLEQVLLATKAKRADLKDTEGRLKEQIRLCQTEIGLGHQWGSMVPNATVDLKQGHAASKDAQAIASIISSVEGEVHLARETGTWVDPPEVQDVNLEDVPTTSDPFSEVLPPLEKDDPTPQITRTSPRMGRLAVPLTTWGVDDDLESLAVAPDAPVFLDLETPTTGDVPDSTVIEPEPVLADPVVVVTPEDDPLAGLFEGDAPVQDELLPGTVTSDDADSFLKSFNLDPLLKKTPKKVGPNPEHLADSDFLENFLAEFESND